MEGNETSAAKAQSEVSLAGLARTLRRWRKPFFLLALGLPFVTAVVMLFTANTFTATGTILVEIPEGQMRPDMLNQLRAFTGLPEGERFPGHQGQWGMALLREGRSVETGRFRFRARKAGWKLLEIL